MATGDVNLNNGASGGNVDPLFIANSDNPTTSLVAVPFAGLNFIRWSRSVRRALVAKNKEGFITGSLKKPEETHSDYNRWKRADYMVVSWILSSMSVELADDFAYIESSFELWCELHERFGQSNGPLVYQLKKEIDALKQENLSIIAYYGKIKKLWDELQSLRAFPVCSCGALNACTCQFLKKIADLESEDRLMQFLLGLNSGFDSTITNILSMDPLPTINRVFSIAQQIEKQKEVSSSIEHSAESSAMAAQRFMRNMSQRNNSGDSGDSQRNQGGYNQGRRDWKKEKYDKSCTHCKLKGHSVDQCFKLIGYPEWYNAIKASKGPNSHSGGQRMVANVAVNQDNNADSPLEMEMDPATVRVSSDMVNRICQEVMRTMQDKLTDNGGSGVSLANFAGPF